MAQQRALAVKPDNLTLIPKLKWKERRNSHRLHAPTHINTCKNQSINKCKKWKEGNKISSIKQRCPVWMFAFVKYECSPRSCPLVVFVTAVEMRCCDQRQFGRECILVCGHRGLDVHNGGGAEGSQRKQKRVSRKWGQPVSLRACSSHTAAPEAFVSSPDSITSLQRHEWMEAICHWKLHSSNAM